MSTDTSIVFEIDKTLIEKTLTQKTITRKISGQTVILQPAIDKKQPPIRLKLEAVTARKSRRQLAEELKSESLSHSRRHKETRTVDYKIVPVSLRLISGAIDIVFLLLCTAGMLILLQNTMIELNFYLLSKMERIDYQAADALYFIGALVPSYILIFILFALIFAATPGKIICGLRIARTDFFRPNFVQIFLRELLKPLSVVTVLGVLMGTVRPYRMLHDWLTGTALKRF